MATIVKRKEVVVLLNVPLTEVTAFPLLDARLLIDFVLFFLLHELHLLYLRRMVTLFLR